jgi:hypothetical protein
MKSIEEFDALSRPAKNIVLAQAGFYAEEKILHADILKGLSDSTSRKLSVLFVCDDIAICEQTHGLQHDLAHFTYMLKSDDKWRGARNYYENAERAFLGALGEKHGGPNSQFATFAAKMLMAD